MARSPLPADLADEFEVCRRGRSSAVVRHRFAGAFADLGLLETPLPPGSRAASAGTAGGRGGAWVAAPDGGPEAVIRPGRRGGWFGRLVRARYFAGDRFVEELILTERLRRRGAPVPEPLAAVRRERRIGYETWLATRRIGGAVPAAEALRDAGPGRLAPLLGAAGRAIRALHEAGGDHADLNAWNVLLRDEPDGPSAWIVDLDRGRLRQTPVAGHRADANLARLRRSIGKLGLGRALEEWTALERGYASGVD